MQHAEKAAMKLTLLSTFLLLAMMALYGFGLGNFGFFDIQEAHLAQISTEILAKGIHAYPTFNGQIVHGEYPMVHMLQAASFHFLGVSPFAARLPMAIIGFLLVFVTYNSLMLLTTEKRFALLATAIVGLNVPMVLFAKFGLSTIVFWFFTLSATLLLIGSVFDLRKNYIRIMIAGFLAAGSVMTGGVGAIIIPLVIGGVVALVRPQPLHNLKQMSPVTFVLAIIVGLSPWVIGFVKAAGPEAMQAYAINMFNHSWPEELQTGIIYPKQLLYYFVSLFPWTLFLPAALMYHFRVAPRRLKAPEARVALPALCFVWLALGLGGLIFVKVEFGTIFYLMLLPTPVLVADFFDRLPEKPLKAWHAMYILPLGILGALLVMLMPQLLEAAKGDGSFATLLPHLNALIPWTFPLAENTLAYEMLDQHVKWGLLPVLVGALVLVGTLVGVFIMRHGGREAGLFVGGAMLMALSLGVLGGLPRVYEYKQQSLHWITKKISNDHNERTDHTIVYRTYLPSVRVDVPGKVSYIDNPYAALRAPGSRLFVVTDVDALESLKEKLPKGVKPECVGGYCLVELYRHH